MTQLTFGLAIEAMKNGAIVYREKWRQSTNMVDDESDNICFVFMQIPAEISISAVPAMQSLPQSVKNHLVHLSYAGVENWKSIRYSNQLARLNSDNSIYSYSPSIEDVMATDWCSEQ